MGDSLGGWEIGRRTLRILDAITLPTLLAYPLATYLGGQSLVMWVGSGVLAVWLVRRLLRASNWEATYRLRFLSFIVIACAVSSTAALLNSSFS